MTQVFVKSNLVVIYISRSIGSEEEKSTKKNWKKYLDVNKKLKILIVINYNFFNYISFFNSITINLLLK